MVKIKDIAQMSGYSTSTVSRLLKDDPTLSVTDETRKKILDIALKLGYQRAKIHTSLEKIALLFWITDHEELEDVYFKQLRILIEGYAKKSNMNVVLIKHEEGIEAIPKDIDGFIAIGVFSDDEVQYIHKNYPYGVFVDSTPDPDLYDSVLPDTRRITRKAIDYFIQNNHKKIGFIGGTHKNPNTGIHEIDIRETTFREYMKEKNLLNESYIFDENDFSVKGGYNSAKKAIGQLNGQLPSAIFVASDPIAIGVLQALNEHNYSIPTDIEIISINNIDIAKYVSPPLSTFHIDLNVLSQTAIELLSDQIINQRKIKKQVFISSELVVRKSFIPLSNKK